MFYFIITDAVAVIFPSSLKCNFHVFFSAGSSRSSTPAPATSVIPSEAVHLRVEEKITLSARRDGALQSFEVTRENYTLSQNMSLPMVSSNSVIVLKQIIGALFSESIFQGFIKPSLCLLYNTNNWRRLFLHELHFEIEWPDQVAGVLSLRISEEKSAKLKILIENNCDKQGNITAMNKLMNDEFLFKQPTEWMA